MSRLLNHSYYLVMESYLASLLTLPIMVRRKICAFKEPLCVGNYVLLNYSKRRSRVQIQFSKSPVHCLFLKFEI